MLQITSFLRSDAGLDAVATGKFNATGRRLVTALPAVLSSVDKQVDQLADEINVAVRSRLHGHPHASVVIQLQAVVNKTVLRAPACLRCYMSDLTDLLTC